MSSRRRRTAEESRAHILDVAASRLREFGLEGLNITGVSGEAGISHATLIHHFGSSAGMREALANKMTSDLIQDLVGAIDARVPASQLTRNVFSKLAEGGHAKLVAWRAVEASDAGADDAPERGQHREETQALFQNLLARLEDPLSVSNSTEVRQVIFLVAIAGIGYGLAGNVMASLLNLSEEDLTAFPDWLTEHLQVKR